MYHDLAQDRRLTPNFEEDMNGKIKKNVYLVKCSVSSNGNDEDFGFVSISNHRKTEMSKLGLVTHTALEKQRGWNLSFRLSYTCCFEMESVCVLSPSYVTQASLDLDMR